MSIEVELSEVELEYQRRVSAMTPKEKMARCAAMFSWHCQQMARQIHTANPELTNLQVQWNVALKLYENEPEVVKLIKENFPHVSD